MTSLRSAEFVIEEVRQGTVIYGQPLKAFRDRELKNDAWLETAGLGEPRYIENTTYVVDTFRNLISCT